MNLSGQCSLALKQRGSTPVSSDNAVAPQPLTGSVNKCGVNCSAMNESQSIGLLLYDPLFMVLLRHWFNFKQKDG